LNILAFAVGANLWLSEWSNESAETFASTRDYFLAVYGGLGVGQGDFHIDFLQLVASSGIIVI